MPLGPGGASRFWTPPMPPTRILSLVCLTGAGVGDPWPAVALARLLSRCQASCAKVMTRRSRAGSSSTQPCGGAVAVRRGQGGINSGDALSAKRRRVPYRGVRLDMQTRERHRGPRITDSAAPVTHTRECVWVASGVVRNRLAPPGPSGIAPQRSLGLPLGMMVHHFPILLFSPAQLLSSMPIHDAEHSDVASGSL